MTNGNGLLQFLRVRRARFRCDAAVVRLVHVSEIANRSDEGPLDLYLVDKVPLFYRKLSGICEDLGDGFFLTPIKETLARLPTSETFRESHLAEIASSIFAEEVMGLSKLYSKLTLLTAENANAFKIDLVLYRPQTDPLEFVFGSVKSSPKTETPARHDRSCYAALIRSLSAYPEQDIEFDLAAAKDNIESLPHQVSFLK